MVVMPPTATRLEYHYQTLGRVLVHLLGCGLARIELRPNDAWEIMTERRGHDYEVAPTFRDVVRWMEAEGLVRYDKLHETTDGAFLFTGVQLTSRGLAVAQQPHKADLGGSIRDRVKPAEPLDASVYTKIGELVGSAVGGFTKSISGG